MIRPGRAATAHSEKAAPVRLHAITHVPFEGPALIADWARERGRACSESLALTEEFPDLGSIGLLVVMGGPMSADDHVASPWLGVEKRYIARAVEAGIPVLGVCLGAQILAEVAGGRVRRNRETEIGWYPVHHTRTTRADPVFAAFPDGLIVGHWHGDTFDLPSGAEPALSSGACANQAFSLADGQLVGVQFHLEWSPEALDALINASVEEPAPAGTYVASVAEMRAGVRRHEQSCRVALWDLLDALVSRSEESA